MFDDLRYLIKDAKVPEATRLSLSILTKAIGWFAVAFVVIGMLLNRQYFIYWMGFILFIEGLLVAALIGVLLMAVRSELHTEPNGSSEPSNSGGRGRFKFGDVALRGIIGHAAFYLAILVILVVLGAMGIFEDVWKAVLQKAAGH